VREALARRETRARVEAAVRERKTIAHLVDMATGAADGQATEPTAEESQAAPPAAEEPSHA
jgi:hypothetical protein